MTIEGVKIQTSDQLYDFVRTTFKISIPRRAVCPAHRAPWDYVWHSFSDDRDCVVWACRGGGKTLCAALGTTLRALLRPGCEQVVLGGSQQQSDRVARHVREMLGGLQGFTETFSSRRRIKLYNSSVIQVLAQSETAVRGVHADKVRCDEVELFDPEVWRAVWFTTTGRKAVRGSLEALSTAHVKGGLMEQLIARCRQDDYAGELFTWCLWEVIEKCPPSRRCETCLLAGDCFAPGATREVIASQKGLARRAGGFFRIDDAIAIKARSSAQAWESEMLCRGASRSEWIVFPEFDRSRHVARDGDLAYCPDWPLFRAIDFGYRDPLVCLWIQLSPDGRVLVLDEYVRDQLPIVQHAQAILQRDGSVTGLAGCGSGRRSPVSLTYVDPAGRQKESTSGAACTELLESAGIHCVCRASTIGEGLELIRTALAPAVGESKLLIHPRCSRLIDAFDTYHYPPPGASGSAAELPVKDGPDHLIDALRYFFVNRARPVGKTLRARY